MERKSFSGFLWDSTFKSWGGIIAALGFCASLIPFFVVPNEYQVPLKFIITIIIVFSFLSIIALRTSWTVHQKLNESLALCQELRESCQRLNVSLNEAQKLSLKIPRVKYVKSAPKLYNNAFALFLVEPTQLLSYDAIVSIYYLEDGIERLVGVGKVINVQENKMIQIIITHDYDFEDKLNKLMNNSKEELDKLILKTSIPNSILQDITR